MRRFSKILILIAVGGALFQTTTTSCQQTIAPLAVNLITSILLQSLLGGFAT